jgi:hypothetical protein
MYLNNKLKQVCWQSLPKLFAEHTIVSVTTNYQITNWLTYYVVIFKAACSQIILLQETKMKLQTVILAVALVTIIGPAAAIKYSLCELATPLTTNGITTNIPDCKYTSFL